ncbi:DUF993 family protein, partial [Bacillus sp. S34]|nr:DUF993 family protein [Bacillus sp. S34]
MPLTERVVYAAAHVVPRVAADNTPGAPADLDWDASVVVVEWGRGFVDGISDSVLDVEIVPGRGPVLGSPGSDVQHAGDLAAVLSSLVPGEVLFIDEIHTLVGAGAAEGAIDAASILKPLLARGELQTIGATTLDEYRKHFEKDAALERRFQQVYVGEPSVEDAVAILRGLKERYEAHHKVSINDSALVAAASLSNRYISGRQLPDKAIDLIDEAASRLRMEIDSSPVEIDELKRNVDRLRVEEFALKQEKD